jgi:hypothetical protein
MLPSLPTQPPTPLASLGRIQSLNPAAAHAQCTHADTLPSPHAPAGYGNTNPDACWTAAWLIAIQSVFALLLEAVTIGIIFARISHPQQRSHSIYISNKAAIARRDGILKFMFRIADIRRSQVVEPKVKAYLYTWWVWGGTRRGGEGCQVRGDEEVAGGINGHSRSGTPGLVIPLWLGDRMASLEVLAWWCVHASACAAAKPSDGPMQMACRGEGRITAEGEHIPGKHQMARFGHWASPGTWLCVLAGAIFDIFLPAPLSDMAFANRPLPHTPMSHTFLTACPPAPHVPCAQ